MSKETHTSCSEAGCGIAIAIVLFGALTALAIMGVSLNNMILNSSKAPTPTATPAPPPSQESFASLPDCKANCSAAAGGSEANTNLYLYLFDPIAAGLMCMVAIGLGAVAFWVASVFKE